MATISNQIADRISGGTISEQAGQISALQEVNTQYSNDLFVVKESLQQLEQALYSGEWRMLSVQSDQEFTRAGLIEITKLARIMKIKNPLIKRGVEIQRLYVWAQGVNITARDDEINAVVQSFLDDERNRAEIGSHQARGEREEDLQQDGNLFFRFFINQVNGRVRVRTIDPNEIQEIICNPEDKKEPWFYKRMWTKKQIDGSTSTAIEYYPDWRFLPRSKVGFSDLISASGGMGGVIKWDTPIMQTAVNRVGRWGVCEYYSANDWALAYKNFLEQLASVWSALARWSAKLTVKGGKTGVTAARAKLNTTLASGGESNPPPVTGSTFISSEGNDLQPFRTAGATMSAEDGRRLLLMAEMTFGFPETFWSDASVGSLATAQSLDRPTELKIIDRQTLWKGIYNDIFSFVTLWAVKAPQGALRGMGRIEKEQDGDTQIIERVIWNDGVDANVDILFPAVIEHDIRESINAIVDAQTFAGRGEGVGIPLETAVSSILNELGLDNTDEIMDMWRDEQEARNEQAAQMADQMTGDDSEEDDGIDDMATEAVWKRQVTAVSDLLDGINEAIGQNGHSA